MRALSRAMPFAVLLATPLLGADGTGSPTFPGGAILAIAMWVACSSRKKEEIGGWLLYYYIQIYIGLIATIVFTILSAGSYNPFAWAGAPRLYVLFLVSTVPLVLLSPAELLVAERARKTRDYRWVRHLRTVLWIHLGVSFLAGAIDATWFPENLLFDFISVLWPLIWLPYFYRSQRVERVFLRHDWLAPQEPAPATAPALPATGRSMEEPS